uniref:Uncharacterized protein n=1 Tax=Macrostomum lignano TaxID=282301 RepID=A0A1I8G4V7_9PLAT
MATKTPAGQTRRPCSAPLAITRFVVRNGSCLNSWRRAAIRTPSRDSGTPSRSTNRATSCTPSGSPSRRQRSGNASRRPVLKPLSSELETELYFKPSGFTEFVEF